MKLLTPQHWQPPHTASASGKERRVGVELEFAGVDPEQVMARLNDLYGGRIEQWSRAEYQLAGSCFGDFKLELDADALKSLADKQSASASGTTGDSKPAGRGRAAKTAGNSSDGKSAVTELAATIASNVGDYAVEVLTSAAEQLVPWEVVSPPIPVSELHRVEALVDALRADGALGTRHALHYAFGVHLNPELPALDAATIVNYLRAYFCLYDWIVAHEKIDTARRLTPYINHFGKDYIAMLIDRDYAPDLPGLIDDYLEHNPSRNRSLDMLPLFAHLDEDRVRAVVDDARVKARPTFHYRLPNCDIDNPDWNLGQPWGMWLEIEQLASHPQRLEQMCERYAGELNRLTHALEGRWAAEVGELLANYHA
ncbi:MAG: amidoligase family protein [Pseudomonadales bacterium]|nr:amidoligase family protein [Pseudomonadales bacterium]